MSLLQKKKETKGTSKDERQQLFWQYRSEEMKKNHERLLVHYQNINCKLLQTIKLWRNVYFYK